MFSPMYGQFQQSEDVGGHGGQCEVITLCPDLCHDHTPADVLSEGTERLEQTLRQLSAQSVMSHGLM